LLVGGKWLLMRKDETLLNGPRAAEVLQTLPTLED
jgi:hypothetical protein